MTELIQQLAQLTGSAGATIWLAALIFVRVGALVAMLPLLGEQMVSVRIRLCAAIGLTLVVMPTQVMTLALPIGGVLAILQEALVGLFLGFSLRLLVLSLQTAGAIAAQSTSLAQMFAGTASEPQPIISNILLLSGFALFVSLDGIAHAAALLVTSYDIVPVGTILSSSEIALWELKQVSAAFSQALSLAAPFVLASLLYNLALGAINRAMPQLMVSFVGAPVLVLGGMAILALSAPIILSTWLEAVKSTLQQPFGG